MINSQFLKAAGTFAAVVIVNALAALGINADVDVVLDMLCWASMVAATFFGCWRNCNFTRLAQMAQAWLDKKKAEKEIEKVGEADVEEE